VLRKTHQAVRFNPVSVAWPKLSLQDTIFKETLSIKARDILEVEPLQKK
jgi:hypothetical protein